MNDITTITPDIQPSKGIRELGWIVSGFYKPIFSVDFYRRASKRSVFQAAIFFGIFTLIATMITTIILAYNMISFNEDLKSVFKTGSFPAITIKDGRAIVDGPQPYLFEGDDGTVVIIDTTGEITEIDRTRYVQGFLLTQDRLFFLNEGQYDSFTLRQLNQDFDTNPIVIDEFTTVRWWTILTGIFSVIAFLLIGLWNVVVRFMGLTFLAVIFWGATSMFKTGHEYGELLNIGIYALVPATYIYFIIDRIGFSFFGFHTLLLLLIWGIFTGLSYQKPTLAVPVEETPIP